MPDLHHPSLSFHYSPSSPLEILNRVQSPAPHGGRRFVMCPRRLRLPSRRSCLQVQYVLGGKQIPMSRCTIFAIAHSAATRVPVDVPQQCSIPSPLTNQLSSLNNTSEKRQCSTPLTIEGTSTYMLSLRQGLIPVKASDDLSRDLSR